MQDALAVKAIEDVTNHDVKAVEYFLRDKVKKNCSRERTNARASHLNAFVARS